MKDFKIRLLKSFSCMLTITSPPLKGAGGMLVKEGYYKTDKLN